MDVELNRGRNNYPSSVPITVISPSTLLESYKKKIYPTGSESNRCFFLDTFTGMPFNAVINGCC